MRKTWPVLLVGLTLLFLLTALSGLTAFRKTDEIYRNILRNQEQYRTNDRVLEEIRSGLYLASIIARDFLYDTSQPPEEYKRQLLDIRASTESQVAQLRQLTRAKDQPAFEKLDSELGLYWELFNPIFEWTPEEKLLRAAYFLRKELRGRRTAIVSIAQEISRLNSGALQQQDEAGRAAKAELDADMRRLVSISLALGLIIIAGTVIRVALLERRTESQHRRTEAAERAMRDLSHQLVHAQEEERKTLSRELHDQVGQLLTAMRMELDNIARLRHTSGSAFADHLSEAKELSARALSIVRDLAMGLRPSMLDDLGLAPAIQWQARDFSRRTGVSATLSTDGDFDHLPDAHRTCVYRIVQEALTNCARHAQARNIRITLHGARDRVAVAVQDDGVGMTSKREGIGLIGIEERVRELNGELDIHSEPGKGTTLRVELPVAKEAALEHANSARG